MFWRYAVSGDAQEWVADSFFWAIEHGLLRRDTPLVTPTREFFRAPGGRTHETAVALVDDLRRILRLGDAPIAVEPMDALPDQYRFAGPTLSVAAGTWEGDEELSIIRYDPNLFGQPMTLISTLAHELMHHVLHHVDADRPGGDEAEELNTDLHCITTGFGVIEMMGAETIGWAGYMQQPTRAHALALFLRVRDLPLEAAQSHLAGYSRRYLKRSWKELGQPGGAGPRSPGRVAARLTRASGWADPRCSAFGNRNRRIVRQRALFGPGGAESAPDPS